MTDKTPKWKGMADKDISYCSKALLSIHIMHFVTFCLTLVKEPFAIPENWPLKKGLTVQILGNNRSITWKKALL